MLTADIQYISPVDGVRRRSSPRWAARRRRSSTTRWSYPTDEFLADAARSSGRSTPAEEEKFDKRFAEITRLGLRTDGRAGRRRDGSGPAARRGSCSGPGLLFLFFFFFFPLYTLFRMSLSASPSRFSDPVFTWEWGNYAQRVLAVRRPVHPVVRVRRCSPRCSRCVIAYPLAYVIAFRGGRFKNILLGLVVVPFFTNFLIRTLAWKTILGDQGVVVGLLRDLGILGPTGTLLRTPLAVDRRAHLQLPAVHGAADLRRAREDRPAPDRRGA